MAKTRRTRLFSGAVAVVCIIRALPTGAAEDVHLPHVEQPQFIVSSDPSPANSASGGAPTAGGPPRAIQPRRGLNSGPLGSYPLGGYPRQKPPKYFKWRVSFVLAGRQMVTP